jgi:hypothetical protein
LRWQLRGGLICGDTGARATVEAVRAVEAEEEDSDTTHSQNTGKDTDSETDTLRWLEAELVDVWARSEGDRLNGQHGGLERHRGDLLTESTPGMTGAALLSRSLGGGCSSRGVMVPPVGVEPTLGSF